MTAQPTQHHSKACTRANAEHVRAHQAPGGALFVTKHGLQSGAVVTFKRIENRVAEVLRQLIDDVGEILDIHALSSRNQLPVCHLGDDTGTCLVVQVRKYLARLFSTYRLPQNAALLWRHRLDQVGNFGRMYFGQRSTELSQPTGLDIGQRPGDIVVY